MSRHVGRDRLAPVVQDLLAVDDQNRVALQEIANLLAKAQRMDRGVLRAHLLVHLGGLLGIEHLEPRDPAAVSALVDLAARLGRELLEHRAGVARDRHVDLTVVVELGRVDVDVDDLGAGREPRWSPELDDVVEASADDQEHVHLAERLRTGVEERQLVIFRHGTAGERRRVERDPGRLDERPERGGRVRPPHAAAAEDQRPLRLREQRDRLGDGGRIAHGAGRRRPALRHRHRGLLERLTEDVAGQVEVDRAGLPRHRLAIRGGDHLGNALGVVDPSGPLGDGLHHRELVDLLERFHLEEDARARPTDRDHRRGVHERVGDPGDAPRGCTHAPSGSRPARAGCRSPALRA